MARILLADDSITIQKVVNLTFADESIEVVAVSNGEMAERRLSEINPDLVLADIFMPGKNGYELCEYIKENPQFRAIPVVLLVGAFEPFDQAEAKRVRADAHLTKPFESRTLVETVRKLIGNKATVTTAPLVSSPPSDEEMKAASPAPSAAPAPEPVAGAQPVAAAEFNPEFNIDFSAVAEPSQPAPAAEPSSLQPDDSFNEASPLDLDYVMIDEPEPAYAAHTGGRSDDAGFGFASSSEPEAAAVSFGMADDMAADPIPLQSDIPLYDQTRSFSEQADDSVLDAAPPDLSVDEADADSRMHFASDTGFGSSQDMVVDFEKLDSIESPKADEVAFDIDMGSQAGQSDQSSFEIGSSHYETQKLEMPEEATTFIDPNFTEEAGGDSAMNFSPATESGFGFADEAAAAALFSVDDPLGDILSDETAPQAASEPAREFAPVQAQPEAEVLEVAAETPADAVNHPAASAPVNTFPRERFEQPAPPELAFTSSSMFEDKPDSQTFPRAYAEEAQDQWNEPRYEFGDTASADTRYQDQADGYINAPVTEVEPEPFNVDGGGFRTAGMWTEEET
ncbi:MAG TPA: response regulator, partial [Blastocatellia bacterium]|nr:response regulator [Blastocatellia bacterium]